MFDYKEKPYCLSEEDIRFVEETYEKMTLEERIGQLFFPIGYSSDPSYLKHVMLSKHPGGILFRTGKKKEMAETYTFLQKNTKVPLFTAANLESGGTGIMEEGTYYANPMAIAATGNKENAYRLGEICATEGKAVGVNYAFAPVVDIDLNYHNPITNVRTYGDNFENTINFSREFIRACTEKNMLTSIKHFPGDGVDERDQHIATTINSLSREEWDNSYGKVYRTLIQEGVLSVMVGHISLPSYQEKEKFLPASLSHELVTGLLKEKLGFKGMVITDATPMVGFCSAMPRQLAVPQAIMAGCDMFLFNKDYDEDYRFMLQGYQKGLLTEKRLEEAVKKILATKAKIGLNKSDNLPDKKLYPEINSLKFQNWSKEVCDQAVTLVKDREKLIPISTNKYKNVLLEIIGECASNERVVRTFTEEMTKLGYHVIPYGREAFDFTKPLPFDSVSSFREKYDLVIYLGNIENASNKTTNRINWYALFGLGNNLPWFVKEVPTIFISLQNPYHLLDVPMVGTYINCYQNNDQMIKTVVEKINGVSSFKGVSPVDPFCKREELKL